jgi:hypothetical protein
MHQVSAIFKARHGFAWMSGISLRLAIEATLNKTD